MERSQALTELSWNIQERLTVNGCNAERLAKFEPERSKVLERIVEMFTIQKRKINWSLCVFDRCVIIRSMTNVF
jgi:hypothetical protein